MKFAILAGGPKEFVPDDNLFYEKDIQWIGVDRGTYHLLQRNIIPIHAFGDFDSVSDKEKTWMMKSGITMSSFSSEKDQTDLELAITWVLQQRPEKVFIFGATGGRLDHCMMNIHLLIKGLEQDIDISLIDKQNIIFMKPPGHYYLKYSHMYKYLSFLPLSSRIENLTLTGVKYPLHNQELRIGDSLCISNEIIQEEASYSFTHGTIIVIRSHD